MKKRTFRKILLFSCSLSLFVLTESNIAKIHAEPSSISYLQSSSQTSTSTGNFNSLILVPVLASDYAGFLNHVATSDPDHLYDEKMGSDSAVACIRRLGLPGNFQYEVIAGRENAPITFVNQNDAEAYAHWLANGASLSCIPDTEEISTCYSSLVTHYPTSIADGSCRLALSSISHLPSSNYWSDAASVALIVAFMITPGSDGSESARSSEGEINERPAVSAEDETVFEVREERAWNERMNEASVPIFSHPAFVEEKNKTASILDQMIAASKKENIAESFYAEADVAWEEEQAAWEERTIAQRNVDIKKTKLQEATQLLEAVTKARSELDEQKTTLGRIATFSKKAAMPLSFVPGPIPLGGIANTVSEVAEKVNEIWVNKDVALAQLSVARVTQQLEAAIKEAEEATTQAYHFNKKANDLEQQSRTLEQAVRRAATERFQPPITSFHEGDWQDWGMRVVQAGEGDPALISLLANHGMSDPMWAEDIVNKALKIRELKDDDEAEKERKTRLEPWKQAYQEAYQVFQQADQKVTALEKTVTTARERLEAARIIHLHWKNELEHLHEELNELEKPENIRRQGKEKKQEEFCSALTQFEEACNSMTVCEETLRSAQDAFAREEAITVSLRSKMVAAEKALLRNQERAKPENKPLLPTLRLPQTREEHFLTAEQLEAVSKGKESSVESPEVLNKVYETIGRALLEQGGENQTLAEQPAHILLPEIREPKLTDLARWEAEQKAEDFIEARNDLMAEIQERCTANFLNQSRQGSESKAIAHTASSSNSAGLERIHEGNERDSESSQKNNYSDSNELTPLLRQQHLQRKNNETASSITIKSQSNRSESSIGSFVTARTGASHARSIAASIPESVASAASKAEMKQLKAATREIKKMANQWAELVRQADTERMAAGGAPYLDEETLFDAWQKNDAIAQAAWQKRCALEEEAARTVSMKENWEASTLRWEARAKADRLAHDLEDAKNDLQELSQDKKFFDSVWLSRHQAASEHFDQMQIAAAEAQQEWLRLARLEKWGQSSNFKFFQGSKSADEKIRNSMTDPICAFIAKLEEKDRAIMGHWEKVHENFYEEKDYETRRAKKIRLAQETGAYKFDLITEKNRALATCFHEFDNEDLEKAALDQYAEMALEEALRAVRENVPGAEEAWNFRVQHSQKNHKEKEQSLNEDASPSDRIMLARLKGIAEADENAFEVFKQEAKEFSNREASWVAALDREEKNLFIKKITAARNYLLGDPSAWNALSHQERKVYNEAVLAANEATIDIVESMIREQKEIMYELRTKVDKAWRVFSKKNAEESAAKARTDFTQIKTAEEKRKIAVRWAKLLDFEHHVKQNEKALQDLRQLEPSESSDTLNFSNANSAKRVAEFWSSIATTAWNDAKAFCDDLEISWERKVAVVKAGYRQALYYAGHAKEAWDQLAERSRNNLANLPLNREDLMMAATKDLIRAEREKYAWSETVKKAESNLLALADPNILRTKIVFEKVRAAWEELFHNQSPDKVRLSAEIIKAQVMEVSNENPYAKTALLTLSGTVDALAGLTIAARKHALMRSSFASGGGVFTAGFTASGVTGAVGLPGVFTTTLLVTGSVIGATIISGGLAAIPIAAISGGLYYYKRSNPSPILGPLAPRTTEVTREAVLRAEQSIEPLLPLTEDTIWGRDIAWSYYALCEAEELINAITGALKAEEEEKAEVQITAEEK